MRVIGVIDLTGGKAVHARGGRRADYAPVRVAAGVAVDGDPVRLARVYVERLGVRELYIADLDAIAAGPAAIQAGELASVADVGAPLWVDAGVFSTQGAREVMRAGASRVVVGLETLGGFEQLDEICIAVGREAVAFSIDLRHGTPLAAPNVVEQAGGVGAIAARAADAGVGTLIVLDLARVGSGAGVDGRVIAEVRAAAPGVALLAGGGVRDADDLRRLADAGCDGALVATALLEGRLQVGPREDGPG